MRLVLSLAVMLLVSATSLAEPGTTVLFNYSPAYDCYRQTLRYENDADPENCTVAIEMQALEAEGLAATYSNRGIILARQGEVEAALADHNRALEITTELSSLYINRANALMRARRYQDAMEDLDRAVALADDALATAHYNRSLLFHKLGDLRAARTEAQRASELSPESIAYKEYLDSLAAVVSD